MNQFDPTNPFGYLDEVPEYDNLTPEERTELHVKGCMYGCIVWIVMFAIALLVAILFSSCSTQERVVTVDHYKTDTVYQVREQRDSIYLSDSIYVSDFVRDDTVFSIRDRWHTRYVERTRTDTLYEARTDTVTQVYETVREVPARLTWWQQTRLHLSNILLYVLAAILILWLWHRRRER